MRPGRGDLGHAAGDVDRSAEPVAAAGRRRPVGDADAHVGEALALLGHRASTSVCRVAISAGTSGEANIAPSPIVLISARGPLDRGDRQVGEAPGDAPEVLGRQLLAEARVADEVGEGDGDVARAGQPARLALGLRSPARGACRRAGARGTGGRAGSGTSGASSSAAWAKRRPTVYSLSPGCSSALPTRCLTASEVCAMPWPTTRADLQQLAPRQSGVDEALDHAGGLDVLVGEDALAAPGVGPADRLHELAQERRRQARLARHVGERMAARAAERELDGQRRQALLGRRALDLLIVDARLAQARQQPLAIAGRRVPAVIARSRPGSGRTPRGG